MTDIKTKKTKKKVAAFLKTITPEERQKDSQVLLKLFTDVTQQKPVMWGESIIGFGEYHYRSSRSTQEGDWPLTAFSPRKQHLSLYIMPGFKDYDDVLKNLGKHKKGACCLYIKRLSDVDLTVLKKLISLSYKDMKKRLKNGTYEYC